MKAIYAPTGLAREYALLAVNLFTGCAHGCLYCYADQRAMPSREGVLEALEREAAALANRRGLFDPPPGPVLLCFTLRYFCDPYQRAAGGEAGGEPQGGHETQDTAARPPLGTQALGQRAAGGKARGGPQGGHETQDTAARPPLGAQALGQRAAGAQDLLLVTRRAVEILAGAGISVKLLSKAGLAACQDLDLLSRHPGRHWFGQSFTTLDPDLARVWEPRAAPPVERMAALAEARRAGLHTWVSLEPILYPGQVKDMVRELAPVVDSFSLGMLNPRTSLPPGLPERAREGLCAGLPAMRRQVQEELERLGYGLVIDGAKLPLGKSYYFKSTIRSLGD